jgi:DNA-binding NarL/FixJ family response regulator
MKKTIVVADKDESLQHAFMTVFSRDHFEILYASTGKEVEKIAERIRPDVYIVNVDLPKVSGIEVYKKLQKQKILETASFFFLKDESDKTELLGYQADGIIEKPLNFFKVYETVTREDEVIELTDLIEEESLGTENQEQQKEGDTDAVGQEFTGDTNMEDGAVEVKAESEPKKYQEEERPADTDRDEGLHSVFGERLRDAMDGIIGGAVSTSPAVAAESTPDVVELDEAQQQLEAQFKVVLNQAMGEAALKLSARLAPILTQYVEDYVKRMLLEIAEKVIKEEIDKLLKESTG